MTARPRFLKRPRVGRLVSWLLFAALGWVAYDWIKNLSLSCGW